MKKIRIYSAVVLVSMLFLINGCSKKDDKVLGNNCAELATAASNAVSAYITSPTVENCNAFAAAISNYYEGCNLIDAATKQSYDQMIESLDCSAN